MKKIYHCKKCGNWYLHDSNQIIQVHIEIMQKDLPKFRNHAVISRNYCYKCDSNLKGSK